MRDQNIYDNQEFFKEYKKLREWEGSANILIEKPALFSLCPDFTGKAVLDLGCGYGENCGEFSRLGASKVIGIDISEKMLQVACNENSYDNVSFIQMNMTDLSKLNEKFDIIVSSLALHYIEDFDELVTAVYNLLDDNGYFIFSQEHPLTTALKSDSYWTKDEEGNVLHYNLTNYSVPGLRETNWIVDGVIKYHRSFSSIMNSLIQAGFHMEEVLEPVADENIMTKYPSYRKNYHKPDFLLIKASKKPSIPQKIEII